MNVIKEVELCSGSSGGGGGVGVGGGGGGGGGREERRDCYNEVGNCEEGRYIEVTD